MEQINVTTKNRTWKQISEKERYKLEGYFEQGMSPKQIAPLLKKSKRAIEREKKLGLVEQQRMNPSNNKNAPLYIFEYVYKADTAQRRHNENASNKGRGLKIGNDHKLAQYIEQKIGEEKYSPDAVIGEIGSRNLNFQTKICTKTLYNYIDKGIFLNISNKDLPVKKDGKKRKYRRIRNVALNNIKGRSIEERPIEIENREEYGHWEMDCVVGTGKTCLLVMTERMSRQEKIFKISAKTQLCVLNVLDKLERKYKGDFKKIFKSITMDNGGEFLDMRSLERSCRKTGTKRTTCYYAHPYSAFERGSNENNNKLIRRFIPKGSNIDKFSNKDIQRIENWMNNYPRKIFGYKSANQIAA